MHELCLFHGDMCMNAVCQVRNKFLLRAAVNPMRAPLIDYTNDLWSDARTDCCKLWIEPWWSCKDHHASPTPDKAR